MTQCRENAYQDDAALRVRYTGQFNAYIHDNP